MMAQRLCKLINFNFAVEYSRRSYSRAQFIQIEPKIKPIDTYKIQEMAAINIFFRFVYT